MLILPSTSDCPVWLCVCLSVRLSICPSVRLSVSVSLFVFFLTCLVCWSVCAGNWRVHVRLSRNNRVSPSAYPGFAWSNLSASTSSGHPRSEQLPCTALHLSELHLQARKVTWSGDGSTSVGSAEIAAASARTSARTSIKSEASASMQRVSRSAAKRWTSSIFNSAAQRSSDQL